MEFAAYESGMARLRNARTLKQVIAVIDDRDIADYFEDRYVRKVFTQSDRDKYGMSFRLREYFLSIQTKKVLNELSSNFYLRKQHLLFEYEQRRIRPDFACLDELIARYFIALRKVGQYNQTEIFHSPVYECKVDELRGYAKECLKMDQAIEDARERVKDQRVD